MNYEEYIKLNDDDKFDLLMNTLTLTNRTPQYYVKWEKVIQNTKELELSLHTLNYLLGKENIYDEALNLFTSQPNLIKAIPILIALREYKFKSVRVENDIDFIYEEFDFNKIDTSNIKKYVDFANDSGLLNFLKNNVSKNLVDYIYGVETGLDSNGRKNRSGEFMEKLIENQVEKICIKYNLNYLSQANADKVKNTWNVEIPFGESKRNHDFVVYDSEKDRITIIEVNYYGGGGSKLKSVAGEFADFYDYLKSQNDKVEFIWITDGQGWTTAKKPLKDAFIKIGNVINVDMIRNNYLVKLLDLR